MKKIVLFVFSLLVVSILKAQSAPVVDYDFEKVVDHNVIPDTSRSGYDAVVTGNVSTTTQSVPNLYLTDNVSAFFDGSGGSITLSTSTLTLSHIWSLAFWVLVETNTIIDGNDANLLIRTSGATRGGFSYWIGTKTQGIRIGGDRSSLLDDITIQHPLDLHTWHHMAFSMGDNLFNFYIDGVLISNYDVSGVASPPILIDPTHPLVIAPNQSRIFIGNLDSIKLFDHDISQDEIDLLTALKPAIVPVETTYVMTQSELDIFMERVYLDFFRDFLDLDSSFFTCNPIDQTPNATKMDIATYLLNHSWYESSVPINFKLPEELRRYINQKTNPNK